MTTVIVFKFRKSMGPAFLLPPLCPILFVVCKTKNSSSMSTRQEWRQKRSIWRWGDFSSSTIIWITLSRYFNMLLERQMRFRLHILVGVGVIMWRHEKMTPCTDTIEKIYAHKFLLLSNDFMTYTYVVCSTVCKKR